MLLYYRRGFQSFPPFILTVSITTAVSIMNSVADLEGVQ